MKGDGDFAKELFTRQGMGVNAGSHTGSGAGDNGEEHVFNALLSAKEEKRITASFFRIIGNMLEAFSYFESSLGLQTALGHASFSPPGLPGLNKGEKIASGFGGRSK